MPDVRAEMEDTIFSINSGVNLPTISFLSSIFSEIYCRRSDSDADMMILDALSKVWMISSLVRRLVTKSLVEPCGRVSSRGSKLLLSLVASHSSRASMIR